MKLPRDVSGETLAKALRVLGYEISRQSGSHLRLTTIQHGQHHVFRDTIQFESARLLESSMMSPSISR